MKTMLPDFSDGFSLALKLWLLFLISLILLGYPIIFSIFLGSVGGFAGGWVLAWWKSKEGPLKQESEEEEQGEESSAQLSGLSLARQRREGKRKKRSQKRSIPFSGFLKR